MEKEREYLRKLVEEACLADLDLLLKLDLEVPERPETSEERVAKDAKVGRRASVLNPQTTSWYERVNVRPGRGRGEKRQGRIETYRSRQNFSDSLVDGEKELGRFLALSLRLRTGHEKGTLVFRQALFEVVDAFAEGGGLGFGLLVDLEKPKRFVQRRVTE
jgi:hypothetical protein